MFTIIYYFKVKEGQENLFIESWKGLTELIYEYEGSLGSRLHKAESNLFIAYAQWPNRETWESAINNSKLPEIANQLRNQVSSSCFEIKTEYKLEVIEDLLKTKVYI